MRVFINPGHAPNGNPDPGAVGWLDGELYRECDIALRVGTAVAKYLEDVGIHCKVFQNDSLSYIAERANWWGADLFVSIHCNAGGGHGTETFCFSYGGYSEMLADCINRQIVNSIDIPAHGIGVKEANYYVLRETEMKAVLVELGFMDNPDDLQIILNNEDGFARAIARGVTDFTERLGD